MDFGRQLGLDIINVHNLYEGMKTRETIEMSEKMDALTSQIKDVSDLLDYLQKKTSSPTQEAKELIDRVRSLSNLIEEGIYEWEEGREKEALIEGLKRLPSRYEHEISDLMRRVTQATHEKGKVTDICLEIIKMLKDETRSFLQRVSR